MINKLITYLRYEANNKTENTSKIASSLNGNWKLFLNYSLFLATLYSKILTINVFLLLYYFLGHQMCS